MYLTGQKTGMIPIFSLIFFIILSFSNKYFFRLILIFPIIFYLMNNLLIRVGFSFNYAVEFIVTRFSRVSSFTNRLELKSQALDLFLKNPVLGAGQDGFSKFYVTNNPHDWNFQILAENGIIGLVFYIMILFYFGQLLYRYGDVPLLLLTSLVYLVISSAGGSNFSAHPFWLSMALLYYYTKNNYYRSNNTKMDSIPAI